MFLYLLFLERIDVCFYDKTISRCPPNVNFTVKFTDSEEILKISMFLYDDYRFYFVDSMNVKNPQSCLLNSLEFNENSTVHIIGYNYTCSIVLESIFASWPNMHLTIRGIHLYTERDKIYAKTLNMTYSIIYPARNSKLTISAHELYLDALSSLHIYQWKADLMEIKMDILPAGKNVTLYLNAIDNDLNITLYNIATDVNFGLKSHYIEMIFPKKNATMRFIPQFCDVDFFMKFLDQSSVISFTNYMVSKSMYGVDFFFKDLPEMNVVFPECYWNLDVFKNFNIESRNDVLINSVTENIPISLKSRDNNLKIELEKSASFLNTELVNSNVTTDLKNRGIIFFSQLNAVNSTIHSNIKNNTVFLTSSNLSYTNLLDSQISLEYSIRLNGGINYIQNAIISGSTSINFNMSDPTSKLFLDNVEFKKDDIASVNIIDDNETRDVYEEVICAKNEEICNRVVGHGIKNSKNLTFENICVKKSDIRCVTFNKSKDLFKNIDVCIVENEKQESLCGNITDVKRYNDIKLDKESICITLHFVCNINEEIILPDKAANFVLIGHNQTQQLIHIRIPAHLNSLKIVNLAVNFTDKIIEAHEMELEKSCLVDVKNVLVTKVVLKQSILNFSTIYISEIEFIDYEGLTSITTTDDAIQYNEYSIYVKSRQTVSFIGSIRQKIQFRINGTATSNLKISNSNEKSRATFSINTYNFSDISFTWRGLIAFSDVSAVAPIHFNLSECVWLCMSDDPTSFNKITLYDVLKPVLSAKINFKEINILEGGSINEYEDGEIFTEKLTIRKNEKNAGNLRAKNVLIYPSTYTTLTLKPETDGGEIDFTIMYSYSSVPYVELDIPNNQRGKIVLQNVDDFNVTVATEKVPVDFLCAPNLDCSKWSVVFESNNSPMYNHSTSAFEYECREGTFNPSIKCLSIIPKTHTKETKMPTYILIIIIVSSVIGFILLVIGIFIFSAKLKRHLEHQKLMKMSKLTEELITPAGTDDVPIDLY